MCAGPTCAYTKIKVGHLLNSSLMNINSLFSLPLYFLVLVALFVAHSSLDSWPWLPSPTKTAFLFQSLAKLLWTHLLFLCLVAVIVVTWLFVGHN